MNKNKEKCNVLKRIRKTMADSIGIDLHQRECTFEGECSGTCPKCQQEERMLNQALLTKAAVAAGIAAISLSMAGCADKGVEVGEAPYEETTAPVCEDETDDRTEEVMGEVPDDSYDWNPFVEGEMVEVGELEGDVAYPVELETESEE